MARLKVAMLATPWLKIPPQGYGGIEVVLDALLRELQGLDVDVTLFSVGESRMKGVKLRSLFDKGLYQHIHKPLYENGPIVFGHIQSAINEIVASGDFDVIHDHNPFVGPSMLHNLSQFAQLPPVIHTVHGPPFDYADDELYAATNAYWQQFRPLDGKQHRMFFVGISDALMEPAPQTVKNMSLAPVHNAVTLDDFMFADRKKNYFLTLARFSQDKGQHIAARLCAELKQPLKMAGTVAGIDSVARLQSELANPMSDYRQSTDFRYYSDQVLPFTIDYRHINYVGNLSGKRKLSTIANAKALLFPITWDEPFGMAVIEALASGTPVIAMNRGAMPEIIEHGVSGFLANDIDEFKHYMQLVDQIDPAACRQRVADRFSSSVMAKNYVERYRQAIELTT